MTPDEEYDKAITDNFKYKTNFYSAMEQDIQEALMTSGDNPFHSPWHNSLAISMSKLITSITHQLLTLKRFLNSWYKLLQLHYKSMLNIIIQLQLSIVLKENPLTIMERTP